MKKADPEELPEHHTDPGGYWADMLDPCEMGSKLWIYNREVRSDETLFKIEQEAIAALEWMKSERLVSDISVSSFFEQDKAVIRINIDNKSIRLNLQ
ncbi:MAG: phage GP46 family protein [Planctomycetaceae bacterium]|nr:phage GP46 family protein [Planctomycetaceae bacterium]